MPRKRSHNPYREKLTDGSVIERDYRIEQGKQVPYGNWRWVCYDRLRQPRAKKVNLYTTSKSDAAKKAEKYVQLRATGAFDPWQDPAQRQATLTKATEEFLAWKRGNGASESTLTTDRYHLERFARSFTSGRHVGNVKPEHVESFLNALGKDGQPASKPYRNRVRATLRHFFGWAAQQGMTDTDPTASTRSLKASPVQRDYITEAEYEAVLDEIEKAEAATGKSRAWLKDWIAFGFGTGLRPGEQRQLKWDAVRLSEGTVVVGKNHSVKTEASRRTVPVAGEALLVLKRRKAAAGDSSGYVFTGAGGTGPVEHRQVAQNIQRFAERAGVGKNVVAYSLRHGYGTRMIQRGVPAFELAKLMGTSLQMIERHYGHFDPKRAASHVEEAFGKLSDAARRRQGLGN